MTTLARRDDDELARGLSAWLRERWPGAGYEIDGLDRPRAGWTNETLLVSLRGHAPGATRLVVRLPPSVPTWPVYDLAAQARVLELLTPTPVPVPRLVAFAPDEHWLGEAFLVMSHEDGRPGPEAPALDPWVTGSPLDVQRRMHEQFLDVLAAIHRVDWRAAAAGPERGDLAGVLRGGEATLGAEVEWWARYVDWASDGAPTETLAGAIGWCASTRPRIEPPASLCWGDARIGNMLFAEDRSVHAVLDWEMATIGAAETDLAWYLALDDLTEHFVQQTVPGFLSRAEIVARYEAAIGRPVVDLEWHEIFALVRSVSINDRQARLAKEIGVPYPGVAGERNPVLRLLADRIDAFSPGG